MALRYSGDFLTVELWGFAEFFNELNRLLKNASSLSKQEWWVGSVVEYAAWQHFGTSRFQGIPYFTIAMERVVAQISASTSIKDSLLGTLTADSAETMIEKVAFMLEREVKLVITEAKSTMDRLIQTGIMRASFAAGPQKAIAEDKSVAQARTAGWEG